ncbi:MAG: mechanosensitive ion channel [Oscillospiraceae bacterium]|nr:mechanosensitive ion channel [Oscillospiraceae bacterium]
MTEILTSALTETAETSTTELQIPNVKESVENASSLLTSITDKFISALPVLAFAVTVFFLGIILSKILLKITAKFVERSNIENTAGSFLISLVRVILYILVAIIALSILNVPMTSIVTVIGTAGIAIGLALQNSLSNLAGGFIILFSKPFKSGDLIEIDNSIGTVDSIGILYTKIITPDNKSIFIPNGKITDAKIINYSETSTRRVDLVFDIAYGDSFEKARNVIRNVVESDSLILSEPEPLIRMCSHKESSVGICVQVWTENENYWKVFYNLTESVKLEFDRNNIEIPYSQIDIHIKENQE